jgi:Ca2+-binding EF-hand superfamily protein
MVSIKFYSEFVEYKVFNFKGELDCPEYLIALSATSSKDGNEKLQTAFKICDINKNGIK